MVQASAQSQMMALQPMLTEEEHAVYKRGEKCQVGIACENQSITDYRRATGFEALMGYLYLKREFTRMVDLGESRTSKSSGRNEIQEND